MAARLLCHGMQVGEPVDFWKDGRWGGGLISAVDRGTATVIPLGGCINQKNAQLAWTSTCRGPAGPSKNM